jgi:hypothetical protein
MCTYSFCMLCIEFHAYQILPEFPAEHKSLSRPGLKYAMYAGMRWSVRSWLGRLHSWWLWRRQSGPPRKGPKHVVVFFNNLKIQLCYDGQIHLISTSIESHNGDDAIEVRLQSCEMWAGVSSRQVSVFGTQLTPCLFQDRKKY